MSKPVDDEADLAERAKAGDPLAFEELHRRHRRAVRGLIRARARNDTDTDEIEQRTWIDVWEHITEYNPARAPFGAFAKYRAWIQILRFYRRTRHVQILIGALRDRYPEIEQESDIWDLIADAASLREAPEVEVAEEAREAIRSYDCALRVTFEEPIPPHQYLAFGFSTLLEWKPARVASELGTRPLREIEARFEAEYLQESQLPVERVESSFAPLRGSMEVLLGDVVHAHKTRQTHQALLDTVVGDTALCEYTRSPLEHDIARWSFAVKVRAGTRFRRASVGRIPQA